MGRTSAQRKADYLANQEQRKAAVQAYRVANPAKVAESKRRNGLRRPQQIMLSNARARSRMLGIPFDLTVEYLQLLIEEAGPTCPVLGIPYTTGIGAGGKALPGSRSLDRIEPSDGYTQGNVQVISWRANNLKSDGTPQELMMVANYVNRQSGARADMTMSNPFLGMNDATTSQSGSYLKDGIYRLQVEKLIFKNIEAGGAAFIAEHRVLESSNADVAQGSSRSWFQKQNKSFKGEVKAYFFALCGYSEKVAADEKVIRESLDKLSEALMLKAITHGIFNGRVVGCEVNTKQQKTDPTKTFSKHTWGPGGAQTNNSPTQLPVEFLIKATQLA